VMIEIRGCDRENFGRRGEREVDCDGHKFG
jgi:hypothetical protein